MRPLLVIKSEGWPGDRGPDGGALGHSAIGMEGGMGCGEREPVTATLWRKKPGPQGLRDVSVQGPTASHPQCTPQVAYPQRSLGLTVSLWALDALYPDVHSGWPGSLCCPPFRGLVLLGERG